MVNAKNKKCIKCNAKEPSFNKPEETKAIYCGDCKTSDMINVRSRKCVNCNIKRPLFNKPDEKKAIYCGDCKRPDMVNIKSRKCVDCDNKIALFNKPDKKKAIYCGDCKTVDMINVRSGKCIKCNNKEPLFNKPDEKKAIYCGDCKTVDMINVRSRKCIECNIKQPLFNKPNEKKAIYCGDCKKVDMINVKSGKCIECNIKQPLFNEPNEKKAIYCGDCKTVSMVNVRNRKCNHCNFNLANASFKPLCATCYRFLNPNEPTSRNYKIKENTIMKFVKDKYPNIILDSVISGGCSKRRPDGLLEFENFSIIIEIDEDAHRSYEDICENKRLMEIYKDLGFRTLRVIRFNPDFYINLSGNKIKSIFSIDKKSKNKIVKVSDEKELNKRVNVLLGYVKKITKQLCSSKYTDNFKSVDIEYLFFNGYE